MRLLQCLLINNDCYKIGKTITPTGIMVHSTGANNKTLKRYIQPDDGLLGANSYGNDWNQSGISKCVHAFIGTLADGTVATYQTLPWNYRGWHGGGSSNNTHIGFEICEDGLDDEDYFNTVYNESVELVAHLCVEYGLDPMEDGVLICHSEGYTRGTASNHSDVMHWFPKFEKSMDTFRADVQSFIKGDVLNMTTDELKVLIKETIAEYNAEEQASSWAVPYIEKGIEVGLTDGTKPQGFATREQVVTMILRATGEAE